MKDHAVAFAWFVGYLAVWGVVGRPLAKQFGVPVLKDL